MSSDSQGKNTQPNQFNQMEIAGAFGDLGTLIPFILVYITILKLNPVGVLFCFGLANLVTGWYYKTPIPVQPMKAMGTIAATSAGQISSGALWGAGLFTGLIWILLAATGTAKYITYLIKKPVVKGILLGLGFSFILESLEMMRQTPGVAILGLIFFLILQRSRKIPAIIFLLIFGFLVALVSKPQLLTQLSQIKPSFNLPPFTLQPFTFQELVTGITLLALPQLPLTIGNGVIALTAENNELFPDRPVTVQRISFSTGLMNLLSPFLGGVPMCHGAGGMMGHVRFGAMTGGATIILGLILLSLALFFGDSLVLLLEFFPQGVLGIILFLVGWELAASSFDTEMDKNKYSLMIITAGIAIWNTGVALLVGMMLTPFLLKEREL